MSKSLYEEAIEAAEQIKFAAEEKVKEKLVESMSPRIKDMVEKTFLKESQTDECCDEVDEAEATEECGMAESEDKTDECGMSESDIDPEAAGYFFAQEADNTEGEEVSESAKRIFSKLITKNNRKLALEQKLSKLSESVKTLQKALMLSESSSVSRQTEKRFLLIYKNLLNEAKTIGNNSIIKSDNTLLKEYLQIIKELKNMSRRRRTRSGFLNESLEDLLETNLFEEDGEEEEAPEDEDEGSDDLDLDLDSDDEGGDELDLDAGAAADEADDLESLVRQFIDDAEPMLGGGGADELDLDLEEPEEEDEEAVEEGTFYEMDEAELEELHAGDAHEGDVEEGDVDEVYGESRRRGDRMLEIDENMLRKEISKMRRIREGEAKDMASHFGGGSLDKEMFVDVDDSDLNVHADHLGREDVPMPKLESAFRNASRKNRMLESKMKDYKKALRGMKNQLSEMNLFNAKLLYANKLMQNRDLSIKQQRNIVESLDEAKTLGEAKILFESLSKSLVKSAPRSGNTMNESASRSVIGGSSRPVSSAQPMNEGVALDRWATLAGIKK